MTKIFLQTMNIRNFIALLLCLIGVVLITLNYVIISVIVLSVVVTIFDGVLNRDIFILKDSKLYLLRNKENMIIRTICFILIMSGFILCICKYYVISLSVFYFLLFIIFMFNNTLSLKNTNFIKSISGFDININGFKTYEVIEVNKDKYTYDLNLHDLSDNSEFIINYKVSHAFNNYKELLKILESI